MERMIGGDFPTLPHRCMYFFLATFPSFYPVKSPDAAEGEQRAAYDFIRGVYEKIYNDPILLGFKAIPDDCLGNWEQQKAKPGLVPKIRGMIYKTADFIELLYNIASCYDVEVKPAQIKTLAKFGVETKDVDGARKYIFPQGTERGLALLAKLSAKNSEPAQKRYFLFSRGVFDAKAPWMSEVFGKMLENRAPYDRLVKFFDENGYMRIDGRSEENQMAAVTLDYVKEYAPNGGKLKQAWAERTRGGIEFVYQEVRRNQFSATMRIPGFHILLKYSEMMNEKVKSFVTSTAKKCDGCKYCVKTDKTGKRPFVAVPVGNLKICPMFCGFQFTWRSLDDETVDNIAETLIFIDTVFRPNGPGAGELAKWA